MSRTQIDLDAVARRCDETFPSLTDVERRIALAVHRIMADKGPSRIEEIAERANVRSSVVANALGRWPGVYRDESGKVVGFWGLSTQPMDHALEVGGRTVYGWCAWDTLFLPEILRASGHVRSTCPATGRRVTLRAQPDGPRDVDPPEAVVSLLDPDRADVAGDQVISSFCHHIHFLASPEAWEGWARETGNGTFMLTVGDAWELGRKVNRLRYGAALTAESPS